MNDKEIVLNDIKHLINYLNAKYSGKIYTIYKKEEIKNDVLDFLWNYDIVNKEYLLRLRNDNDIATFDTKTGTFKLNIDEEELFYK